MLSFFVFSTLLLELLVFPPPSVAISTGAPDLACPTMTPGHGPAPQSGSPAVKMVLDKNAVAPGEKVKVKLEATSALPFKGFFMNGRDASEESTFVGSFRATGMSLTVTCFGGVANTITHNSPIPKQTVEVEWTAPEDFNGEIVFRFSVVFNFFEFWVNNEGERVKVDEAAAATTKRTTRRRRPRPDGEEEEYDEETTTEPMVTTTTSATTSTTTAVKAVTMPGADQVIDPNSEIFEGCGETKSCFGTPSGCIGSRRCILMAAWSLVGTKVYHFHLLGKNDGYIALGLSADSKMGDDVTSACIWDPMASKVMGVAGVNYGFTNRMLNPPSQGISEFEGSFTDGQIECSFNRERFIDLNDYNLHLDLKTKKYTILISYGAFAQSLMWKHRDKEKSAEPTSLEENINLEGASKIFIKLHGALMISAWIGCGSCGILLSRYFKNQWTAKIFSSDIWFLFHRIIMSCTWVLTLTSFCIIFYELDGIGDISIQEDSHAMLGCFTTLFTFIQPFVAFARPAPDSPKRPAFNKFHFYIGTAAQYMSLTAIFFSVELDKAQLPGETIYMLMVFMAIHVTIHSTLSIVMYSEMPLNFDKPLLTAMPKAPTYSEKPKKKPVNPVVNPFSMAALGMLNAEQTSGKKSFKNLIRVKVIGQGLGADDPEAPQDPTKTPLQPPPPSDMGRVATKVELGKAVRLPPLPSEPSSKLPAQLDLKSLGGGGGVGGYLTGGQGMYGGLEEMERMAMKKKLSMFGKQLEVPELPELPRIPWHKIPEDPFPDCFPKLGLNRIFLLTIPIPRWLRLPDIPWPNLWRFLAIPRPKVSRPKWLPKMPDLPPWMKLPEGPILRRYFLLWYFATNWTVTVCMVLLVIYAPSRQSLVDFGLLHAEEE